MNFNELGNHFVVERLIGVDLPIMEITHTRSITPLRNGEAFPILVMQFHHHASSPFPVEYLY